MKQIMFKSLFNDDDLNELKEMLSDTEFSYISLINECYKITCKCKAFGINFEDAEVNEKTLLTRIYYSIPEFYETDWFSYEDNIIEILKSLVVDCIKAQYKLLVLKEEEKTIEEDELKIFTETMTKYYCKTRTGECWTEEKSKNEIEKYIKEVKEKYNVIFDKFSRYKEV